MVPEVGETRSTSKADPLKLDSTVQGFFRFNKGLMRLPLLWKSWVMLVMICNMILPLILISHIEAQVAIAVFAIAAILMSRITSHSGFTRLLGLGHFVWFPLIAYLWSALTNQPTEPLFVFWIYAVLIVNSLSLLIDVIDVIRILPETEPRPFKVCKPNSPWLIPAGSYERHAVHHPPFKNNNSPCLS